jgi:hypothetical protein
VKRAKRTAVIFFNVSWCRDSAVMCYLCVCCSHVHLCAQSLLESRKCSDDIIFIQW